MKNAPCLNLSFAIGLRDFFLRAHRFEFTDNGEFSLVPFSSEANIEALLALGFTTENYTDWTADIRPEELKVTISHTYYATGPQREDNALILGAAIKAMQADREAMQEQNTEAENENGPAPERLTPVF